MHMIAAWVGQHCSFGMSCHPDVPDVTSQMLCQISVTVDIQFYFSCNYILFQTSGTEKIRAILKYDFVLVGIHIVLCLREIGEDNQNSKNSQKMLKSDQVKGNHHKCNLIPIGCHEIFATKMYLHT